MIGRPARLLLVCIVAMTAMAAARGPFWTPSATQVARLETLVEPSARMEPLAKYDRAYAGMTLSGREMIEGRWVRRPWSKAPQSTDPRIVAYSDLIDVADGGCSVVTMMYDVVSDKIAYLECNGRG